MPKTVIVVPCYNEARRLLREAFLDFVGERPDIHLLFVNDGSTDATLERLQEMQANAPENITVLHQPRNAGKAQAVRAGMLQAFEGDADYVGYWDADLATPLDEIPLFLETFEAHPTVEIVFGSRVNLLGRNIDRRAIRHVMGRVFATAASLTLGLRVYDTQCGAKLFRKSDAMEELFVDPWITNWIFDVELMARLIRQRAGTDAPSPAEVIYEQPVRAWHDVAGSKVGPADFVKAIFEMVAIHYRYLR
ncbi:MAG: dolichyl-phosphate beta-glucosyltransferase [Myxococcota bacterium]